MKIKHLYLYLLSMTSLSFAQNSFTYSFEDPNGSAWPSDWSGTSFASEGHHSQGWGFDEVTSATDDFTGAYIGDQFVNVTGAKYYNARNYDVTRDSLNYTMAWNANGQKGLFDEGKPVGNQIFQIGVFSSTPVVSQFGTGIDPRTPGKGSDSFYLAGVELSSNVKNSQQGSLDLKYFDENSVELANFGTMNYTAIDAAGSHIFNFSQDFVNMGGGVFNVTLIMDEYVVNAAANTTTFLGQTSFGTQSVTHGLNSITTLTPGLGIRIIDNASASITAANYDGGVPVKPVPEPSSIILTILGSVALLIRRRR